MYNISNCLQDSNFSFAFLVLVFLKSTELLGMAVKPSLLQIVFKKRLSNNRNSLTFRHNLYLIIFVVTRFQDHRNEFQTNEAGATDRMVHSDQDSPLSKLKSRPKQVAKQYFQLIMLVTISESIKLLQLTPQSALLLFLLLVAELSDFLKKIDLKSFHKTFSCFVKRKTCIFTAALGSTMNF